MNIVKDYIVDEYGKIKSVLIDYDLYKKIEPILLDIALGEAMKEVKNEDEIDLTSALKMINIE